MAADANVQSVPSDLLSLEENNLIVTIVGNKRQSKATAVVQMFHANPDPSQWTKFKTGVVCLVKDNIKRSYYIRLIDLVTRSMVYEQELYHQFAYKKDTPSFHSFPGDSFIVGITLRTRGKAAKVQ
eukprot:Em0006g1486a